MANYNIELFQKVSKKGYTPRHVAEVGVWHPNTSNIYSYIKQGIKTTLVEPDPTSIGLIKKEFGNMPNLVLHEVAICDFNGKVELYQRESSTFVSSLTHSPALINDDCDISTSKKFIAKAMRFNEIDDGTIDLISIDTEGSEWFVIKNMISRPSIISIETHGGIYTNPFLSKLLHWMHDNDYSLWFKNASDSIFVKKQVIPIKLNDKINIVISNIKISMISAKKRIAKKIKRFFKQ